jgi:hypothetical protein
MKFATKACLALAGCALTSVGMAIAPAYADDWDYAIDSFNDGHDGSRLVQQDDGSWTGTVGAKSAFEFYGMALKSTADQVFVAINSNLSLGGEKDSRADDGWIDYGDLFLNFSGKSFADAEADGDLFGVRFAGGNDSQVQTGVYRNVTSEDLTASNSGFWDIDSHRYYVEGKGGSADFADLDWTGSGGGQSQYFGSVYEDHNFATSIASGERVGDVELLNAAQLVGLDFGQYGAVGDYTFGFSFDRSLLPEDGGDFIAHLVAECINDGMALLGQLPSVTRVDTPDPVQEAPEPALASGLLLLGSLGVLKRRTQQKAEMA